MQWIFAENTYFYRNLGIQEVRIIIDGMPIMQPIHTDFRDSTYPEALLQILNATGNKSCLLNSQTCSINNIWAFNLTPRSRNALTQCYPVRSGSLRIEPKFCAATEQGPFTITIYGLMDSVSEIDGNNNAY